MNQEYEKILSALKKGYKTFLSKNVALKIISLLFAMLIWGYVMMETNPERTKTITDIPVSFIGENDLLDRGLAIRGDHKDILKSVTARVSVELTKYIDLDPSDINATVSLRTVSKADTYKLKIDASAKDGTILSVHPSELVIEVDELGKRVVPIEVEYAGELPEGYWKGEPVRSSETISVSGPADDVSTVSKAICTIDLNGRTTSFNESILLKYVDKNGEEVDSGLFLNHMPSVVVKMDVLKIAVVPVNAKEAVVGADSIPAKYQMFDVVSTPATVRLVGPESALKGVTGIDIEQIDVSGSSTPVQREVTLAAPEGTTLLDDPVATIYVDIREKEETVSFTGLSIGVEGLDRKLKAELAKSECDLEVTGRLSLIRLLERKDVKVYVDATGLTAGTYDADITVSFPGKTMQTELQWKLSIPKVSVTIKE